MMDRWKILTERERMLILVGGVLLGLMLVYFGIYRPLEAYHQSGVRALVAATATYDRVSAGAAEISAANVSATSSKSRANIPASGAASSSAKAAGVSISRLQPGDGGTLTIWVEDVTFAKLYLWLDQMAKMHSLIPAKISIQKTTSADHLRVQLQIEGAQQ